jgi:hypothetical protein
VRRFRARLAAALARLAARLDSGAAGRPDPFPRVEVRSIEGRTFVTVDREPKAPPGAMRLTMNDDGSVGAEPVPRESGEMELAQLMIAALEGDVKARTTAVTLIESMYAGYEFDGATKRNCPFAASLDRLLDGRHDTALLDRLGPDEVDVITRIVDRFAAPS